MQLHIVLFICSLLLLACSSGAQNRAAHRIQPDTATWQDQSRLRAIPVAIYQPRSKKKRNLIPVIVSHGYGANKGGDYLTYSYLTAYLAAKGYFVVSIQHELPTDSLLPLTGRPQTTRRSNWERGARNIYFIIEKMKQVYPHLNYSKLVLVGHSNGGDMSVLFAHQHPELVSKLISLDNRRMELPRVHSPQVFSIRSNDYSADEGVLPSPAEQKKYRMQLLFAPINHGQMDNSAVPWERRYLRKKVLAFLRTK